MGLISIADLATHLGLADNLDLVGLTVIMQFAPGGAGVHGPSTTVTAGEDQPNGDPTLAERVRRYWTYLSPNGRLIHRTAALLELEKGGSYTQEEIAAQLGIGYGTVRSFHRTSGRSARKWTDDTGSEAPVRLEKTGDYDTLDGGGWRTKYAMPEGVAAIVAQLPA